jgi:fumarate reductase flavoprotein subunit
MAEDEPSIDRRERALMAQPDWSFWCVYDQAVKDAAPSLFRRDPHKVEQLFASANEDYVTADSLDELARKCGLRRETLLHTVGLYNRGQAVGSDMWGRRRLPRSISQAPFYAVRHYGCSITSYPGLKVDQDLRVMNTDGGVIEGLYAAGEVIGIGFLGHGFLSGSIVSSAVTFGRRLGRDVLR